MKICLLKSIFLNFKRLTKFTFETRHIRKLPYWKCASHEYFVENEDEDDS